MIHENLTKENFWNELQEKYPYGMKIFCDWIDEYKKANDWDSLFPITKRKKHWMDIKFHHLPLAMQIGIWLEFAQTHTKYLSEWKINLITCDWRIHIKESIKFMNIIHKPIHENQTLNQTQK